MPDELQITPDPPRELVQVHNMRMLLLVRLNNAYALYELCFQILQGLQVRVRGAVISGVLLAHACIHTQLISYGVLDDFSCCEGAVPPYRRCLFRYASPAPDLESPGSFSQH